MEVVNLKCAHVSALAQEKSQDSAVGSFMALPSPTTSPEDLPPIHIVPQKRGYGCCFESLVMLYLEVPPTWFHLSLEVMPSYQSLSRVPRLIMGRGHNEVLTVSEQSCSKSMGTSRAC